MGYFEFLAIKIGGDTLYICGYIAINLKILLFGS